MQNLHSNLSSNSLTEMIEYAQGFAISKEESKIILDYVEGLNEEELQDYNKLPYERYAQIQKKYTNVGFGDMSHSADFVECAAFGPGSELLTPFIKNTFLHNMMLTSCGVKIDN